MYRHKLLTGRVVLSMLCLCCLTNLNAQNDSKSKIPMKEGYAHINGLKMYYEIHGKGMPLVLLHGGGSTITTTFGNVLAAFAAKRQVIAVELQAHGHTADIDRPLTFEQDADDVVALLKQLNITKADVFGFSNGGSTAMQVAIRHPDAIRKLVVASSFFKRDGVNPQLWTFMAQASLENMPQQLKDAYLRINPDPKGLSVMHDKDRQRMLDFKDWPADALKSIQSPTLLIVGDKDVVRPEHAVEMYRLIPQTQLAILPAGHGDYIGEITSAKKNDKLPHLVVAMIEEFLGDSETENKK